jgi:Fe-S-cluster containining protein
MAQAAESEGNLCLACGLCCSGAIFDHADLQPGEIDPIVALGATLYPGMKPRMAFPCTLLCGKACTVYEQRPAACREYRCQLLIHHKRGGLSDSDAMQLITQALDLVGVVEALLPADQTIADVRRKLQMDPDFWRTETGAEKMRALDLIMAVAALNLHLDRHFRSKEQRLIREN